MTVLVLLVSLLIGIILADIAFRTFGGLWFRSHLRKIVGLLQAFRETAGDDERQVLLLNSGRMTLQFGLVMLTLFVALAALVFLAPWLLEWNESQQIVYFTALSVVATSWWIVRPIFSAIGVQLSNLLTVRGHAYGVLERWLHWLALEPLAVRQLAFDLERQFSLPKRTTLVTSAANKAAVSADGAVYVCGLARSGTTMLLRILDQINTFRSLTYRDMPFVLAPNLWKHITRHTEQRSVCAGQRAHGDGVLVDFDSPEGFEEVFWRTFGNRTLDTCCFGMDEPSAGVLAAFADYRALVANPRTEPDSANGVLCRYLSKNNNNLLRLPSLCADPTATVLLVYRNPAATARSLHRQHKRFCAIQTEDRFTRTYMGWLAHHEFGLDHLPFCFASAELETERSPNELNYWLDYWNAVYRHILAQADLRVNFVNYDALCAEPVEMLTSIFSVLGIQADVTALAQQIFVTDTTNTDGFCPKLLRRAEVTHRALLDSPKNILIHTYGLKSE